MHRWFRPTAAAPAHVDRSTPVCHAVALLALLVLLPASTASAAPTPSPSAPPQLSIAVDDGRAEAAKGDKLTYTVTVTNLGTEDVKGLRLSQTVPAGTTLVKADRDGELREGAVHWKVRLEASAKTTLTTTLELGSTSAEELRLATIACASTSTDGPPVVCAADSNLLPAGERAQQSQAEAEQAPGGFRWWYGVAGLAAIVLLVVSAVVLVRLRRRAGADLT